jgi:hypothetical protein
MDLAWHSFPNLHIVLFGICSLMQTLFGTTALGFSDWAFLATLAVIVIFAEEIRKWFSRRLTK